MGSRNDTAGRQGFLRHLDLVLEKFLRGLLPEERRYLVLVPFIGILAGLLGEWLDRLLHAVQTVVWGPGHIEDEGEVSILTAARELAETHPLLVVAIPALGGLLVATALLFFRAQKRFQGTAGLMEAIAFRKGRLPFVRTITEGIVSITAVGMGASLGREGAMVHSGAAVGSWLGARFRLADHHVKILLACGAAGGMAAAYDAPVGATIFAMEILVGSFSLELFGPIILSAVFSTWVSHIIFDARPVYDIAPVVISSEWEIVLDLLLGALLGLVSVLFIRVFSGLNVLFRWLEPVDRAKPILAMTILGAVGIFFPELFGNGYDTVNLVLQDRHEFTLTMLFLLPVLKIIVTALCRAGGVTGGLFTPSLFVGALLGYGFGLIWADLVPGSLSAPGVYALVGMGAMLAGTLQAPITSILMIFELTRDYGFILPLMSACIASAVVSHFLQEGSIYTEPLRRRGISFPTATTPTWIRQPEVRSFIRPDVATVHPAERFKNLTDKFLRAPEGQEHLYVTTSDGVCIGVISLHDIKRFFQETENLDSVIAADLIDPSFKFVYATDPISRAIELLSEQSYERLPVLDGPDSRHLLGTVSKRKLLAAYRRTTLARQENGGANNGEDTEP